MPVNTKNSTDCRLEHRFAEEEGRDTRQESAMGKDLSRENPWETFAIIQSRDGSESDQCDVNGSRMA